MTLTWWRRWRAQRERQREIPEPMWQATLDALPFVRRWPAEDLALLRQRVRHFLDEKEFSGAGGLEVTDPMALSIAVQACLPVLRLGADAYRGFVGIVLQPGEVVARREYVDEHGIAHEFDEVLAGEAVPGGPLMLSWPDVRDAGHTAELAYNLVMHEFAHVIDMADGLADGIPPLPDDKARRHWDGVLQLEYERFCRRVDSDETTALDPYGAEAPAEFFAVAAEAFFVSPEAMREEHPWLYPLFVAYFRQDPAALPAAPGA